MKTIQPNNNWLALTDALSVERDADGIPKAFRLFASGETKLTQSGQPMRLRLDAKAINDIVAFADRKGSLIPIDANHYLSDLAGQLGIDESDLLAGNPILGEQTANGYASLSARADGLWAHVDKWSDRAKQLLSGKGPMVGYFSPVIRGLQKGPLRVTSIAMVNSPAINGLDLLAASDRAGHEASASLYIGDWEPAPKGDNMHDDTLSLTALSSRLRAALQSKTAGDVSRADLIEQIAKAAGRTTGTINDILNQDGDIKRPTDPVMAAFASVLDVDLTEITKLRDDLSMRENQEETKMEKAKLIALLALIGGSADSVSLSDDAELTADGLSDALAKIIDLATAKIANIGEALSLSDANLAMIEGSVASLKAKESSDSVRLSDLESRLATVDAERKSNRIQSLKEEGKLVEAQTAWANDLSLSDLEEWAKSAPVIVPRGTTPALVKKDEITLTADEREFCEANGHDQAKFLETKIANAGN